MFFFSEASRAFVTACMFSPRERERSDISSIPQKRSQILRDCQKFRTCESGLQSTMEQRVPLRSI